jgi:hypothetical protein
MADKSDLEVLLRRAIAAVTAGRAEQARQLLSKVIELDPANEKAWLWMSGVVSNEERVACLKEVLAVNPHNEYARVGWKALLAEPSATDQETPDASVEEAAVSEPSSPAEVEVLAAANAASRRTKRACALFFGLSLLALVACAVCGVAVALCGTLVATGPFQAEPTAMPPKVGTQTAKATATAAPAPVFTFPPTFAPSPTNTPVPTKTLVVPDARIPGFPIINEGAYEEIRARVRDLRDLESLREIQRLIFTRYSIEEYLSALYAEEEYVREMEVSERIHVVLGLIDEDYDLLQAQIESQREGLAGLYDCKREEIYLVLDRYASDLWVEVTFAHEFTHALQDQHFDLDSLLEQAATTDSRLALQALIERDATLVMVEYAFQHLFEMDLDRADLLDAIQEVEQGEYQDAPEVVRETAWFPYSQGVVFAAALVDEGGWAQLNQALAAPPQTTEQIMHPDKYLAGEVANIPDLGDLLGVVGPGWLELRSDVLGELFIRVYLERELDPEEALMAGEGWDGDRAPLLENQEQDSYILALRTMWDSQANAEEFYSFYRTFMERAGDSSRAIDGPQSQTWWSEDQVTYLGQRDREVLIVLTRDEETLDLILTEFPAFQ